MKVKLKIATGKVLELEGKVLKKRTIFGRDEVLIEGRLIKPIWVTAEKSKAVKNGLQRN